MLENRMNNYVSDFLMDDDDDHHHPVPATRPRKSFTPDQDVMELLWQNGPVVMQSQTRTPLKKFDISSPREIQEQHQLFMQEGQMLSWLHYPLNHDTNFDQDFCADLLYPSAACVTSSTTTATHPICTVQNTVSSPASRPPIPPSRRPEAVQNFAHFSKYIAREAVSGSGMSNFKTADVRESTVVESNDTPVEASISRTSEVGVVRSTAGASSIAPLAVTSSGGNMEITTTCEITVTSSSGCSNISAEPPPSVKAPAEDRKRKGQDEDTEYHSEDAESESADVKKQARGSKSSKRSRAAEVHNLSERRRRDRINEKMRALQELIPRCNKTDKASMLDEAIEYLKSLQMQVQMMSMGCSMVPMMFPGVQQYTPPMGMGMGMGMGMELGVNLPMMPFPNVLAGTPLPNPSTAAHMGPRFPMPTFHMPHVPHDLARTQAANQPDSMLSSPSGQIENQPRMSNFADPYQQYFGLHPMQLQVPQNQAVTQPDASKPTPSQGTENVDNNQSG